MTYLAIPDGDDLLDHRGNPTVYSIHNMEAHSPRSNFQSSSGRKVAEVRLMDEINMPYPLQDIAIAVSSLMNGHKPTNPAVIPSDDVTLYFHRIDDKTLSIHTHIEGSGVSQETYRVTMLTTDNNITDEMMSGLCVALNGKVDRVPKHQYKPSTATP